MARSLGPMVFCFRASGHSTATNPTTRARGLRPPLPPRACPRGRTAHHRGRPTTVREGGVCETWRCDGPTRAAVGGCGGFWVAAVVRCCTRSSRSRPPRPTRGAATTATSRPHDSYILVVKTPAPPDAARDLDQARRLRRPRDRALGRAAPLPARARLVRDPGGAVRLGLRPQLTTRVTRAGPERIPAPATARSVRSLMSASRLWRRSRVVPHRSTWSIGQRHRSTFSVSPSRPMAFRAMRRFVLA